jgi:Ca-activated chloride channel family protein
MKKYIIIIASLFSILNGDIIDDYNTYKAQDSYVKKDLAKSIEYYKKIDNKTDEIKYNLANDLYKQKKYDEAISWYSEIASKDLLFKKYHNLGNAYAMLNKIDTAIKNYEEALKIKNDKDTKFNLDLLKKKEQEKKDKKNKDKQKNKDKNKDKKKQNSKDKDQKDDMDKEDQKDKKTSSNPKKDQIKEKKDNVSNNQDKAKKAKQEELKKQDAKKTKEENINNTDLSQLEERKWSKMLNNKELNTLMIPLKNKGEKDEQNIKPW